MSVNRQEITEYPDRIIAFANNPKHFGRMNDPSAGAFIKGLCGDEMEFYLVIKNDIIREVKFYTEGCAYTIACGEVVARNAEGASLIDALAISPKLIIDMLCDIPPDHKHCAILAVSTLYRAIADFLLRI
jgi:NifU-like protein involved in Fe-S cluster formation